MENIWKKKKSGKIGKMNWKKKNSIKFQSLIDQFENWITEFELYYINKIVVYDVW